VLSLPVPVRILLSSRPADFCNGLDSLAARVREESAEAPLRPWSRLVFPSRPPPKAFTAFKSRVTYSPKTVPDSFDELERFRAR
jgi:hypothetical protein